MKLKTMVFAALAALCMTSGAQATLLSRLNGQAVYDDVADLTWLRDANYAKTSGYDSDGRMDWPTVMAWVSNLNIEGVKNWHLPGGPMGGGYNQPGEMGNMFYNVLGGQAMYLFSNYHGTAYSFFQNIQDFAYWTGLVTLQCGDCHPQMFGGWYFDMAVGWQTQTVFSGAELFAWAVHDGDVGGNPVPAPGTLALLGAGLLGWAGKRARRARA